jgi:hypothetical protein
VFDKDTVTLRCCSVRSGEGDRPKEFATKEGTKHVLFTLKREKP